MKNRPEKGEKCHSHVYRQNFLITLMYPFCLVTKVNIIMKNVWEKHCKKCWKNARQGLKLEKLIHLVKNHSRKIKNYKLSIPDIKFHSIYPYFFIEI